MRLLRRSLKRYQRLNAILERLFDPSVVLTSRKRLALEREAALLFGTLPEIDAYVGELEIEYREKLQKIRKDSGKGN